MAAFFQEFLDSFSDLASVSGLLALANIAFIDLVMSGDNAILIGMATNKLKGKDRKRAIFFGITLATLLRVVLATFAVYLLGIVGLKLAGGLLLLYVVWKFYRELRSEDSGHGSASSAKDGLWAAISTIVIADVSMSLDNVLAVAGASHGNLAGLAVGLVLSIILMAFASAGIAKLLEGYPQIQWLGLAVILFVAIEMVLQGSHDLETGVFHVNVLPFVAFVIGAAFLVLQQKFLRPIKRKKLREWMAERFASVLVANFVLLIALVHFGDLVTGFLRGHPALLWSVSLVLFLAILEMVSVEKR
jgi:YjbE family integral membrane protein